MRWFMIKTIVLVVSIVVSMSVNAADIYGLSEHDTAKIMKKYGKEISEFETAFEKESFAHLLSVSESENSSDIKAQEEIKNKRLKLMDKITKDNGFLFVDLQLIFYPAENKSYITIEIVDKQHPERLRFINDVKKTASTEKKRTHKPDLIESMVKYNEIVITLLPDHQLRPFSSQCPVYHCTVGFGHPKLKPYLTLFNTGAIKQRALILETLNHDPDPVRRAAAAFLIGHFHNPHEIIAILSRHIADKDELVRNNVMRVIAATMEKDKISNIDIMPFLDALDSPYNTDRNKALYVLLSAAKSKSSKPLILQNAGDKILALLHLKQPNNHDLAYEILKIISDKDFGSTNVTAWTAWVTSAKNQSV